VKFEITTALIIFFADLMYWFLTVFLINKVLNSKSIKAGLFAAALNFNSYIAVFYFVKNLDYLTPACLGAFTGAILAVEYDKKRQEKPKTKLQKKEKIS